MNTLKRAVTITLIAIASLVVLVIVVVAILFGLIIHNTQPDNKKSTYEIIKEAAEKSKAEKQAKSVKASEPEIRVIQMQD